MMLFTLSVELDVDVLSHCRSDKKNKDNQYYCCCYFWPKMPFFPHYWNIFEALDSLATKGWIRIGKAQSTLILSFIYWKNSKRVTESLTFSQPSVCDLFFILFYTLGPPLQIANFSKRGLGRYRCELFSNMTKGGIMKLAEKYIPLSNNSKFSYTNSFWYNVCVKKFDQESVPN